MNEKSNPKTSLLEHSSAKVELYGYYLSVYLNILSRVTFIEKIYLYDLFAGEGVYENGKRGSALIAGEKIKNHHFKNNKKSKNIRLFLNDSGYSEIETNILKIDRIKKEFGNLFIPQNVEILYSYEDFNDIVPKIIKELNDFKESERALILIDPYGYKDIDPDDLKKMMENKKTELILFLPIDQMYRFVNKCKDKEFQSGIHLRRLIESLFPDENTKFDNELDFIYSLDKQLYEYLEVLASDPFTIEKERNKYFSLFYFTNNQKGYETWLAAKWKLDDVEGTGYRFDGNLLSLFSHKKNNYKNNLIEILKNKKHLTNKELKIFGLKKGMLPKHTNEILKHLQKDDKINIDSLDGKPARSFYINDNDRKIGITWKD